MTKAYVSSTFRDLVEYREVTSAALRRLGVDDVSMEFFAADSRPPLERCLAGVAEADLYIGVFAWRYGAIPPGESRSIVELEYDQALQLDRPTFIFLASEDAPWPRSMMDRGPAADRLEALRDRLRANHTCVYFNDPADLQAQVTQAIRAFSRRAREAVTASAAGRLSESTRGAYLRRLRESYARVDLDPVAPALFSSALSSVFVDLSTHDERADR